MNDGALSFSDHLLIQRRGLLERLKTGKKYITGSRRELLASTFDSGRVVQVVNRDGKDFISTRHAADRDDLSNRSLSCNFT